MIYIAIKSLTLIWQQFLALYNYKDDIPSEQESMITPYKEEMQQFSAVHGIKSCNFTKHLPDKKNICIRFHYL